MPVLGIAVLACAAARRQARRHQVEIQGLAFVPAELEVAQGDTVVWINRDLVAHTATDSVKPGWTTGPIAQGDSGVYVVAGKGEEAYACEFHPSMVGKLVVK